MWEATLIEVHSLFGSCETEPNGAACLDALKNIGNPYWIGDQPAGTEVSGWLDAWTPAPSAYAIRARNAADIAAGVNFARENNLRLVVKGGGHSYLGTSNAPDSLLIWTRAMSKVTLHDAFVGKGCEGRIAPVPAVSAEAGAVWMDLYNAVTTEGGRYVQGGGCTTVGVAGLVQSGGFGSFSKGFGTAASGLLEAEIVTADGHVRIVNACTDPDLFWAIKGGGGGTFGVVTRLTLRTHDLPKFFGGAGGKIKAQSDAAFQKLIARFIGFYHEHLFNPHWGEQVRFRPGQHARNLDGESGPRQDAGGRGVATVLRLGAGIAQGFHRDVAASLRCLGLAELVGRQWQPLDDPGYARRRAQESWLVAGRPGPGRRLPPWF